MSEPHRSRSEPLLRRGLGVPWLFAAAYSAVGFSIYFALGVVADRGLGLTPLIFLAAGLLFGLTTLSYVEGGAMFRERGGSSTFARHAFNELIAFIAGWAILIDYLIVIALAAISVPHYLEPISPSLGKPGWEIGCRRPGDRRRLRAQCLQRHRAGAPALARGARPRRPRPAARGDRRRECSPSGIPTRLTAQLDLFTSPSFRDIVYAAVVAMLAYAGIEAASDLAPDIDVAAPRSETDRLPRRGRGAVGLRRDGGDRADGGAGCRRAPRTRTPRSAAATSRRRCWGSSPPSTPLGWRK